MFASESMTSVFSTHRGVLQNSYYYFFRDASPAHLQPTVTINRVQVGEPFRVWRMRTYLGQFNDTNPDPSRGSTATRALWHVVSRWWDSDTISFRSLDYREVASAAEQTVLCFRDTYSTEIQATSVSMTSSLTNTQLSQRKQTR